MTKLDIGPATLATLLTHVRTPLYRNAYALILSTFATSGLGIVYWALAARLYPTEAVGLNSALISTMVLLSGLAQLNLKGVFLRFIPSAGRGTERLVRNGYAVSLVAAACVGVVFVAGLSFWSPALAFLGNAPWYAPWFVVSVMTWGIFALQDNVLTGLRETVWVPVENTIFGVAKIVLLVALAGVVPDYGIFASWTIPVALSLPPVNYLILGRLIPRYHARAAGNETRLPLAQFMKYVSGDYIGSLFALAPMTLLPLMVTNRAGGAANAYFYLAWVIANTLQLINANMATSLTVEGVADPMHLRSFTRRALVHGLRLLAPLLSVLLIGAPLVLTLFGKSYVEEGVTLLRLLALVALPHMFNALYISIARVQRRVKHIVAVQGSQCVLALGLSYILLGQWGITGVGVALLISETCIAIVLYWTQLRPFLAERNQ